MKELPSLKEAQNPRVNARRATFTDSAIPRPGSKRAKPACAFCKSKFPITRIKQKFCSNRCRLLFWAAGEIIKEFQVGKAEGMREAVKKFIG